LKYRRVERDFNKRVAYLESIRERRKIGKGIAAELCEIYEMFESNAKRPQEDNRLK